jgi:hypothetical protein
LKVTRFVLCLAIMYVHSLPLHTPPQLQFWIEVINVIMRCFLSWWKTCRDCGQVSGEVLVYRNPGLHFGDIHILKATYVRELEDFVGNAKYAIFFPCKGPRSLADEMSGGDFDGDMFFVSRNPQVSAIFLVSRWN